MHDDLTYMRRALRLAALGRHASPNPMVGCVVVDAAGLIVGEGWHPMAGQPHAEVFALRQAGELARGASAFVTLEPCAHHGRTPPCADALLAAGIRRVVAAMADPDIRVAGQGLERLRGGGVAVSVGLMEAEARALNAAYIKHRVMGLPWVVLKTAMTLDGKIATASGDSKWITSSIARKAVHRQLRDRCDAILTGAGTVLADDPSLTTRLMHKIGRSPWRIVVDSRLRTPLDSQIVQLAGADGRTVVATLANADPKHRAALEARGCQVVVCSAVDGRVDIIDLMHQLGTRGDIIGVLIESGGQLAASLLAANLVDRWLAFIAPKVVGGTDAPGPVATLGLNLMADAKLVQFQKIRRCGPDIVIDARFG
ncbi:MAG: bifunctional diaminohydroxyphosphoribosylaminopyrimidine deaminase/5-amino-6-(5-phosphoribosylamino)uracil reductase RibD [Janthinobacterium lividum]